MKILHRYIGGQLLKTFGISLVVFTFILLMGNVIRIVDLIERGVAGGLLLKLFLSFIPYLLAFSIPMSILTSTLLTFGRLSSDNEITAMRACGLSYYRIFLSGLMIGLALTVVCYMVNTIISPKAHYAMRKLRFQVGEQSPEALLEPGVFIDYFKPYQFYIGQKEGRIFKDVIVYEKLPDDRIRFLKARSGEIGSDESGGIVFKIYDGTMEEPPREGEATSLSATFKTYVVKMNKEEDEDVPKKMADFSIGELTSKIHRFKNMLKTASPMLQRDISRRISMTRVEVSERFVYTFCALAFVLVGMPLGITAHRSETAIGGAISLALVGLNYASIICMEAFQYKPWLYPHLLVWLPNITFAILGPVLIYRLNRR
ncbi:MAG: LptF/LptG family permease [Candidatus Aureabacteria bacterium]|nr:LptF/LptG family permease [Candidatus Auribacterota bacterium]